VNKFAIGAAILGLTSVVGADMIARLAQNGALPRLVFVSLDQGPKRSTDNSRAREPQSPILALGLGVDMSATAPIPSSASLAPCGAPIQAVLMTHSIGVEGTTVTPFTTPAPPCDQSHKQVVFSDAN
jgi:hypothetical protein